MYAKLRYLAVTLGIVAFDQATKYWAYTHLRNNEDVTVITSCFKLSYVENRGIAFGLFNNSHNTAKTLVLSGISLLAVVLVSYFILTTAPYKRLLLVALTLILGGIIGNMVDRIHLQFVIDFLELYFGSYHWPNFNIADAAICIGAGLLTIDILTDKETVSENNVSASAPEGGN